MTFLIIRKGGCARRKTRSGGDGGGGGVRRDGGKWCEKGRRSKCQVKGGMKKSKSRIFFVTKCTGKGKIKKIPKSD